MSDSIINLKNISCKYGDNISVFEYCNLEIKKSDVISLIGPSGSGKSSLLHILGLLMSPTKGEVYFDGKNVTSLSDKEKTMIRRKDIGFVYQAHHLLPEYNALDNVAIPCYLSKMSMSKARKRAKELLTEMGLKDRLNHQPSQLSGGEQQRVAIARSMAMFPKIIIADEPTGNLDVETSEKVMDYLLKTVKDKEMALIIATHDITLASKIRKSMRIEHKKIIYTG